MSLLLVFTALAAEPTEPTAELTPPQTRQVAAIESQLAYYSDAMEEHCGFRPTIEWATFIAAERFEGPASTVASACQGAIWAAGELCQDAARKPGFTKKVERLTCSHVATKKETGVEVQGNTLVVRVNITDTGAGAAPASYMAPDRVATNKVLDKHF